METSAGPTLTVFRHLFESLAEEMGVTLTRAAFSPNIRERLDFSCALFDCQGQLVAQAAHIPVHLGSMPDLVIRLAQRPQSRGDCWVVNSPYEGGTHLPDLTLVAPLFDQQGERLGFAGARAHHADIGGMTPGSMPLSQEIFQEGLILPPVHLVRRGRRCQDTFRILMANVRTPREREGDILAQLSACRQAQLRLSDLERRYGAALLRQQMRLLQAHSQALTGLALAQLPDQAVSHEEWLEWSPLEGGTRTLPLRLRLQTRDGRLICDFRGSHAAVPAPINAARPVTCAAVYYSLLCFLGQAAEIPINQGVFRCVEVITEPGSVLEAVAPAAVAAGNVETSQRVVDLVLGALARLCPDRVPACSGSSMNNLTVGGVDPRTGHTFTYYETAGGGYGGGPRRPGLSAAQIHMTNTRNTPAETLEREYPLRLWEYALRSGSGGGGLHRGGDGLSREMEFLTEVRATLLATRRSTQAAGVGDGEAGAAGQDFLCHQGERRRLPGQGSWACPSGSRLRIETPGGGGWSPTGS